MKQLIGQPLLILIWIISLNLDVDAQSYLSLKENTIVTIDTCKNNSIKKDTVFYPDIDWEKYKDAWIEFDERPEFPGGEIALTEYIKNNINYPQHAIEDSIQGKVVVFFVVNEYGCTENIKIYRGIRNDLDNECIRVIKGLPGFKPASTIANSPKGWYRKPASIWYSCQINFLLKEDKNARGIIILPGQAGK